MKVDAVNNSGNTALCAAAYYGHHEICAALVTARASVRMARHMYKHVCRNVYSHADGYRFTRRDMRIETCAIWPPVQYGQRFAWIEHVHGHGCTHVHEHVRMDVCMGMCLIVFVAWAIA